MANANQFENWINGHPAQVVYKSGQITYSQIDLSDLSPGDYVPGFSNKFSIVSEKTVTGHVALTFEKQP